MREMLSLQALNKSGKRKHGEIFKKAHRIMGKQFQTAELSEEQVEEIAAKYPELSIRQVAGGDIFVRSFKDRWLVKDEGRFLSLYHNELYVSSGKMKEKYHIQDIFLDLDFLFASIVSHDDYRVYGISHTQEDISRMVFERRTQNIC